MRLLSQEEEEQAEETPRMPAIIQVGQKFDVKDTVNKWLVATCLAIYVTRVSFYVLLRLLD